MEVLNTKLSVRNLNKSFDGKKVLMVDGDMQLNLTISFFDEEKALDFSTSEKNIHTAIKGERDFTDYVVSTAYQNLDMIPSTSLMSSVECDLFTKWQREFILRKCLKNVKESGEYDFILLDAPPTRRYPRYLLRSYP